METIPLEILLGDFINIEGGVEDKDIEASSINVESIVCWDCSRESRRISKVV